MDEWLATWTSLPNLHPAVVHFPIALVPLAAALDLAAAALSGARPWLARAAAVVWPLAAVSAGLAYWAGEQAEDSFVGLELAAAAAISRHADWALYTLWTVGLLAAARLAVARWRPDRAALLAAAGALGLGALALVGWTAELGGALVYRHGVGVASTAAAEAPPPAAGEAGERSAAGGVESRLERTTEGGLAWRPAPGDAEALGGVVEPLTGSASVRVAEDAGDAGLALAVSGRALLALPGAYGDAQVEAELDVAGFRGTVGLAHHAASLDRAGLFTIGVPGGELALRTLRGDEAPAELDRGSRELTPGPLHLGVYAVGRHLRGMVGGETVLHGHEPALPDGRAGLYLDGDGTVVVRSITVTPVHH